MNFRRRWFTTLQNFEFEIESVEGQIEAIDQGSGLSEDQRVVLAQCKSLLERIKDAFARIFPREMFIWQSLYLIQQNMLLILPRGQLRAKWRTLTGRLAHLGKAADASLKHRAEAITRKLGESESHSVGDDRGVGDDRALRYEILEFRKSLDDLLVFDIWRTVVLRRYSVVFSLSALACIALLVVLVLEPESGCALDDCGHGPVGMIVAGFLGGLLSGAATMRLGETGAQPPLAKVEVVRPVIGAIASLFLFFIAEAQAINVPFPGLYALAIAFGFTERAFYRTLHRIAGGVEGRLKGSAASDDGRQ